MLKESSTEAIEKEKFKIAGQPKIDLKTFGEGKNLNYTLEVDSLPEIKLKSFENFKATEYIVKANPKLVEEKFDNVLFVPNLKGVN